MTGGSPFTPQKELSPLAADQIAARTRTRYKVLALTFLVSFVMYLDRVCMGCE